eukprot:6178785-Pleurochrysis_carterae.AAC.3
MLSPAQQEEVSREGLAVVYKHDVSNVHVRPSACDQGKTAAFLAACRKNHETRRLAPVAPLEHTFAAVLRTSILLRESKYLYHATAFDARLLATRSSFARQFAVQSRRAFEALARAVVSAPQDADRLRVGLAVGAVPVRDASDTTQA